MFLLSHIRHGADGDVVVTHCAKVGAFAAVPVSAGQDRVFHRAVPECEAGVLYNVDKEQPEGCSFSYLNFIFLTETGNVAGYFICPRFREF